ncbi:hypothetical protein JCM3770_006250 [Rhodotorula araucariae]
MTRRGLAAFPLFPLVLAGDRTFTIVNSCEFTLWPAITNYGVYDSYRGPRGWEAPPGNVTTLTITSPWNGRIWPRRACSFDGDGKGSCITGDCPGGLECDDQTIGWVNVGEWNLDAWGGNDCWTVPMSVEPDGCDSVFCTEDVLSKCPDDRMKQTDSDGNVIGCLSACMAGIHDVEPSINCCSGKYNDVATCLSAEVDYYDVLKPLCENAYWYPFDSRPDSPTVDYACPAAGSPGYKVTFCPSARGQSIGADKSGGGGAGTGFAQPTSFSATAGQVDAGTTVGGGTRSAKTTGSTGSLAVETKATEATKPTHTSPASSSSPSGDSAKDSSSASDSASPSRTGEDSLLGISQPLLLALAIGAVALVLLGLLLACRRRPSGDTAQRPPGQEVETSSGNESTSSGSESDGDAEGARHSGALVFQSRPAGPSGD